MVAIYKHDCLSSNEQFICPLSDPRLIEANVAVVRKKDCILRYVMEEKEYAKFFLTYLLILRCYWI